MNLSKTGILRADGDLINENLVLNSLTTTVTSNTSKQYTLSQTIPSGTTVTISCRIDADNIILTGNKRIGIAMGIPKSDGSGTQWFEAWASYGNGLLSDNGSFHGYVSKTATILGDTSSIGGYIQTLSSGSAKISQIKVEINDHRTAWAPNSSEFSNTQGFIEGSDIFRVFDGHVEANEFIEF